MLEQMKTLWNPELEAQKELESGEGPCPSKLSRRLLLR